MSSNPYTSPRYGIHRVVAAPDGTTNPWAPVAPALMNSAGFQKVMIQVLPVVIPGPPPAVQLTVDNLEKGLIAPTLGTSTPVVEVMWWCPLIGKFIPANGTIIKTAAGAGVPFEFELETLGRQFGVRWNSGQTGVDGLVIAVSAFQRGDLS
jgi:hypothetical protein